MGFREVEAFGASGNVVFAAEREPSAELTVRIQEGLARCFGYDVAAFLRTGGEVRAIAERQPFSADDLPASRGNVQVAILDERPCARTRTAVLALATDDDRLAFGDRELYWLPFPGAPQSRVDANAIAKLLGLMTFRTKGVIERIAIRYFAESASG